MSEFKDLQPEVCETQEQEAPPKLCPTCKPDPSYIEPTWWETTEAYLNKKICEYQVNMISTKQVSGLSQNEIKYATCILSPENAFLSLPISIQIATPLLNHGIES